MHSEFTEYKFFRKPRSPISLEKPKGKVVSTEETSGLDNELRRQTVLKSDDKA